MKKAVFTFIWILFLAACLPLTPAPAPTLPPNVDAAGTAAADLKTVIVQTLTAQPTTTSAPVVSSATPTLTQEVLPSPTQTVTATAAIEPAMAVPSGTFEVATSTNIPANSSSGLATSTLTPGVLTYGTLPPAVPFSTLTLINRAKTQAYISLQVTTREGGPAILEYPVKGRIEVQAPVGSYLYVAWVGGRKMVGEFRIHQDEDLELVLYRDRIEIK